MRISNEIHIYELILLLINHFKISATLSTGKYLSDYEYPEIPLLFSCKEETKGNEGSQFENRRDIEDKDDFLLPSGDESIKRKASEANTKNAKILKPWMRSPFADEAQLDDKERQGNKQKFNFEKWSLSDEGIDVAKNMPYSQIAMNEDNEKPFLQTDEKTMISGEKGVKYNRKPMDTKSQSRRHKQIRKLMRKRNKIKIQDDEKGVSFVGTEDKIARPKMENPDEMDNCDFTDYGKRNVYHNERFENQYKNQDKQFKRGKKIKDNIYRGSVKSREYDVNSQDYEGLANNVNEGPMISEHLSTSKSVSENGKTSVISRNKYLNPDNSGFKLLTQKMEDSNITKSKIIKNSLLTNNIPSKLEHFPKSEITAGIPEVVTNRIKQVSKSFLLIPQSRKDDSKSKGFSDSKTTPSFQLPIPDYKGVIASNSSKINEISVINNEILARPANRSSPLHQNTQLLAKPPVKIANMLIEKHSEEEMENGGAEGPGTKVVNLAPVHSVTHASTAVLSVAAPGISQNNEINLQEHIESNKAHVLRQNHVLPKTKRNAKENSALVPDNDLHEAMENTKNILSKESAEHENNMILLNDMKQYMDADEASGTNKMVEPQFYSMSKGNSPLSRVSSLMTKFKPNKIFKKNRVYEEKLNDSVKRSCSQMYDEEYDYYENRGRKAAVPLLSYYDYNNDYDLDYGNDKDYSRVGRLNNSIALTAEKEIDGYNDERDIARHFSRNRRKFRKHIMPKIEGSYSDIFAHPLSLDDPELQIVRGNSAELVNRHRHEKNYGTRRHRMKFPNRKSEEYPQIQPRQKVIKTAEQDAPMRSRLRKKKADYKIQSAKKPEVSSENKIYNERNNIREGKDTG